MPNDDDKTELDYAAIAELRQRIRQVLPDRYDTDFNLHRWLISARKLAKPEHTMELAERNLRRHLRYRRVLRLDEENAVPNAEENPLLKNGHMSRGKFYPLASNKCLWWTPYGSFDLAGLLNKVSTGEFIRWHFWLFEEFLRAVNENEARTKQFGGVYQIIDMHGYEVNPFAMLFAGSGQMGHYMHMFSYEQYPELISPYVIINTPKWLAIPIKIIKPALPKDFTDRFRIVGTDYKRLLLEDLKEDEIPAQLGGKNPHSESLTPTIPKRFCPSEYYKHKDTDLPQQQLLHIQVGAKDRKALPIELKEGQTISWFFTTDADIHFGVFYVDSQSGVDCLKKHKSPDVLDKFHMLHPYIRLAAKLVPENASYVCPQTATYYFVFCNKHSWLYRRNIYLKLDIDFVTQEREILERLFSF